MRVFDMVQILKVNRIYRVETRARDPDSFKIEFLVYRGYCSKLCCRYFIWYDPSTDKLIEYRYSQFVSIDFIEGENYES